MRSTASAITVQAILLTILLTVSLVPVTTRAATAAEANASCQPILERNGKKCNTTTNGAIVEGVCNGGKCEAKTYTDQNGKKENVDANNETVVSKAKDITTELNSDTTVNPDTTKFQGRLGDNPTAGMGDGAGGSNGSTNAAGETVQSTRPSSPLDSGWDNQSGIDPAVREAGLQGRDAYMRNGGNSSPSFDFNKELGNLDWTQYGSDPYVDGQFRSGRVLDLGYDGGFGYQPNFLFVSNAELGAGAWGGSSGAGIGSYSGFGGADFGYQMDPVSSTGFASPFIPGGGSIPTFNNGSLTQAASMQGNTSAVVWGAGANPQSAAEAMMAQSQAQLQGQENAKNAGTIANYLGADGQPKSFGQYVSSGLDSAVKSMQGAYEGFTDSIGLGGQSDAAAGSESGPAGDTGGNVLGDQSNDASDAVRLPDVEVDQPQGPLASEPNASGRLTGDNVPDVFTPGSLENQAASQGLDELIPGESSLGQTTGTGNTGGLTELGGPKASPFDIPSGLKGFSVAVEGPAGVATADITNSGGDPFSGFRETANANASGYVFPDSVFSTAKAAPAGVSVAPGAGPSGDMGGTPAPAGAVPSGPSGPAAPARGPAAPTGGSPGQGGGGGMEGIGQMLQSLMGMLKGGGGGGSGSGSGQSMPPVTAASNSVLQTPVPSTQFVTAKPLAPAPTVSVVANPDSVASGAQSIVSWSAVWNEASTTQGECAVIDATGTTLVASAGANSSYQTNALTRSAFYIVGCKQQGGKLGSGVVLVKVKGDTQGPVPLPAALATYQSTTGLSDPATDLSSAIRPSGTQTQQPEQKIEVACDPNSSSYFDCLTSKMQFVDKLYE